MSLATTDSLEPRHRPDTTMRRLVLLFCTLLLALPVLARETPQTEPATVTHYDKYTPARCPRPKESNGLVMPCGDRCDT